MSLKRFRKFQGCLMQCKVMYCKSPKTQRPQKPRQRDQLIHWRYTISSPQLAKLLVSFRCQVKVREGQAVETTWGFGCNRWWWRTW